MKQLGYCKFPKDIWLFSNPKFFHFCLSTTFDPLVLQVREGFERGNVFRKQAAFWLENASQLDVEGVMPKIYQGGFHQGKAYLIIRAQSIKQEIVQYHFHFDQDPGGPLKNPSLVKIFEVASDGTESRKNSVHFNSCDKKQKSQQIASQAFQVLIKKAIEKKIISKANLENASNFTFKGEVCYGQVRSLLSTEWFASIHQRSSFISENSFLQLTVDYESRFPRSHKLRNWNEDVSKIRVSCLESNK